MTSVVERVGNEKPCDDRLGCSITRGFGVRSRLVGTPSPSCRKHMPFAIDEERMRKQASFDVSAAPNTRLESTWSFRESFTNTRESHSVRSSTAIPSTKLWTLKP